MNLVLLAVVAGVILVWGGRRPGEFSRRVRSLRDAARRLWGSAEPASSVLSEQDARRILGVDAGADRAAVEAAYRRLMQKAHPDRGGSSELAAKINAARDLLLGL